MIASIGGTNLKILTADRSPCYRRAPVFMKNHLIKSRLRCINIQLIAWMYQGRKEGGFLPNPKNNPDIPKGGGHHERRFAGSRKKRQDRKKQGSSKLTPKRSVWPKGRKERFPGCHNRIDSLFLLLHIIQLYEYEEELNPKRRATARNETRGQDLILSSIY
jgi:hypothetical protein